MLFMDGQLTFCQIIDHKDPVLKEGGGEKTEKLSTFIRFFFKNCFPVSPTLTKAFLYVFKSLNCLQFCFTKNICTYCNELKHERVNKHTQEIASLLPLGIRIK